MDFIGYLPEKEREQLQALFSSCPRTVRESIDVIRAEKGKPFIRAGEPCRYIYILLRGRTRGIELHLEEKIYVFRNFAPGQILGEPGRHGLYPGENSRLPLGSLDEKGRGRPLSADAENCRGID